MKKDFIANRITSMRMSAGISEYKISKNIGKCNNYINKVASGSLIPTIDSLSSICEYFGITLSQFFKEEDTTLSLTAEKIIAVLPHISEEKLQSLLIIVNSLQDS